MSIREKITREDLEIYEILRNPALFGEFYRNIDMPENLPPFEYAIYQSLFLCDFSTAESLCCGRAVGKTVSLTDYVLWLMVNNLFGNEYVVYSVPNKVHLEPVFSNIEKFLRTNTLLMNFVEQKKGINSSDHTVTLLNSSQLICRIAGQSGGGANVVGLHTPIVIVDEAAFYPWGTWIELQPVLNTWQKGHKLLVSGVPNGLREHNVLYYADEVGKFSTHRVSSHQNPRYSADDEERNQKQYGGTESEDYIHLVLGRHGAPTFAVFDRRLMTIETYPVYKISINGTDDRTFADIVAKLYSMPKIPPHDNLILGVDLGYTEPSSFIILYEKGGKMYEYARINLYKVDYPIQEKIIDFLDTKFGGFNAIGIDSGNEQGLAQHLVSDDKYLHKTFDKRMVPVKFGSWIDVGKDIDGEPIRMKVKPFSTTLLQEYTNNSRIVYSTTDFDLVTELERMTYTKSPTGEIIYKTLTPKGGKKGEDHNTAALLCATIAYNMFIGEGMYSNVQKPLMKSKWII